MGRICPRVLVASASATLTLTLMLILVPFCTTVPFYYLLLLLRLGFGAYLSYLTFYSRTPIFRLPLTYLSLTPLTFCVLATARDWTRLHTQSHISFFFNPVLGTGDSGLGDSEGYMRTQQAQELLGGIWCFFFGQDSPEPFFSPRPRLYCAIGTLSA